MCGICGFAGFGSGGAARSCPRETIRRMTETLVHRGPDSGGILLEERIGVALGHRRLSILDLTPEGNQPMASPSGRYVVVYNGEIYNFQDLRDEMEGDAGRAHAWRGTSDTEVLLSAFERWGFEPTLRRLVGMFAFALLDRSGPVLLLARDRFGEKPLYYGTAGGTFLFASELKAFHAHPTFAPEVDRDALAMYLRRNYVPAPHSIFRGVRKLPPGTFLAVGLKGGSPFFEANEPVPYWSALDAALAGKADPFRGDETEGIEELDRLLRRSVRGQKAADVPLGAFLSGGVDSSLVVSLLQAESDRPVRTFTVGFEEDDYSEAKQAAGVAGRLGTVHTEFLLSSREALESVPKIATLYDEPFADCSQIPTHLVACLARKHVTVCLTGDGGDELFAGYNRHFRLPALWELLRRVPPGLRTLAAGAIRRIPPASWDRLLGRIYAVLPERKRQRVPGDRFWKLSGILDAGSPQEMYLRLLSHWRDPSLVAAGGVEPRSLLTHPEEWPPALGFLEGMLFVDQVTYLPDDILVKADRAAMGASLETRMPFLDHRVAEFSWRLPLSFKIRGHDGKRILKELLRRYVPERWTDRKKMGFGMPIDSWLRGPLREWAESLLDASRLRREGILRPAPVRAAWSAHLSGKENRQYDIWNILMLQSWLESERSRT